MGDGISELFKSMGATHVISGGQTMNPSTEDIVKVIEQSKCKRAIILPNNKNIMMASEQAASIVDAEAVVVPSKSIPQGIAALFNYDEADSLSDNKARMNETLSVVSSGAITYAVRDTKIDGIEIKKDEFMGLIEDKIVTSNPVLIDAAQSLLETMIAEDSEIVTLIVGAEANQSETESIVSWVEANYEDVELDVHQGDQPVYPYLISVE